MDLSAPCDYSYLQHQQKELSSVMFIDQHPVNQKNWPGINPMGLGVPRADSYI